MKTHQIIDEIVHEHAVEDRAHDFVEEELGRYDFLGNWQSFKTQPDALERVQKWLGEERDMAAEIIAYLDRMANNGQGWKR